MKPSKDSPKLNGMPTGQLVAIFVALDVLIILPILYFVFVKTEDNSKVETCMDSMAALNRGLQLYIIDHDDTFPVQNWSSSITQYLPSRELKCSEAKPPKDSYSITSDVSGKKLNTFPDPRVTISLVETDQMNIAQFPRSVDQAQPPRHERDGKAGNNVGYADGSVNFLPVKPN